MNLIDLEQQGEHHGERGIYAWCQDMRVRLRVRCYGRVDNLAELESSSVRRLKTV